VPMPKRMRIALRTNVLQQVPCATRVVVAGWTPAGNVTTQASVVALGLLSYDWSNDGARAWHSPNVNSASRLKTDRGVTTMKVTTFHFMPCRDLPEDLRKGGDVMPGPSRKPDRL
jgi:hypothetical protein